MEKRTLIIIFAILLLFGVGGLGAYLAFVSGKPGSTKIAPSESALPFTEPGKTPSPTSTELNKLSPALPTIPAGIPKLPASISNWKIYKNEKYRYEIAYPLEGEIQQWSSDEMVVIKLSDSNIFVYVEENLIPPVVCTSKWGNFSVEELAYEVNKMGGREPEDFGISFTVDHQNINEIPWNIVFEVEYRGMGEWTHNLCASFQKGDLTYVVNLEHEFGAMRPGEVIGVSPEGKYERINFRDIAQSEIKKMYKREPHFVSIFFDLLENLRVW